MLETQPSSPLPPQAAPADPTDDLSPRGKRVGWLEERLQLTALNNKYGRKAFPVHSTFFRVFWHRRGSGQVIVGRAGVGRDRPG
jgi:hypothetical protein